MQWKAEQHERSNGTGNPGAGGGSEAGQLPVLPLSRSQRARHVLLLLHSKQLLVSDDSHVQLLQQ
jgi:hypothetical protein